MLVFSRTKHGADRIGKRLTEAGIPVATLHSNRTQGQRLMALKRFKSGDVRVLIATDIAARGIDVDGISHVINYDFPPQPEDYVHRIGRTGRAHAIGDAISFITHDDQDTLRKLEKFLGRGIPRKNLEGLVAQLPAARRASRRGARRARPASVPAARPAPADQRSASASGGWPRGGPGSRASRSRFGARTGPKGRRGAEPESSEAQRRLASGP